MKSIRWVKVKLQETIKPNISNKSKNILGTDRVEQFMHRRNVEVSLSYHVIVATQTRDSTFSTSDDSCDVRNCDTEKDVHANNLSDNVPEPDQQPSDWAVC